MKFKMMFIVLFIFVNSIFFSHCQKDPDTKTERLIIYSLLCPNGIDACYANCTASNNPITGSDYKNLSSCTSLCDTYCSLSFLLVED